jgi:hypothetical protein
VGKVPSVAMQRRQQSARSAEWGESRIPTEKSSRNIQVPSPAREGIEMTKHGLNHRFIFAMQSFNDSPWKSKLDRQTQFSRPSHRHVSTIIRKLHREATMAKEHDDAPRQLVLQCRRIQVAWLEVCRLCD